MIFKTKQTETPRQLETVKVNETPPEQVKYAKFLGLYIDHGLTWKCHKNSFFTKISKIIGILAKARYNLFLKTLLIIKCYNSMFLPLSYLL